MLIGIGLLVILAWILLKVWFPIDTQSYYCYPCKRRLVSYKSYLYHTDLHRPTYNNNTLTTMNIDKASVETYAKAPKTIALRFPAGVSDFSSGDTVQISPAGRQSVRRTVSQLSDSGKTAELSNGMTVLTEDGFGPKLRKNKSYLHIKIGKRFVTYKVVGLDAKTVSLRKVLANAPAAAPAPSNAGAISRLNSALSSAQSAARDLR